MTRPNIHKSMARAARRLLVGGLGAIAMLSCSDDRGSNRPPCRAGNGSAIVSINAGVCPTITAFTVAPSSPAVGGIVNLSATVVDPDSDSLTFSWTATSGTVTDPDLATATYACAAPGSATIRLTVSDGTCVDASSADITCP